MQNLQIIDRSKLLAFQIRVVILMTLSVGCHRSESRIQSIPAIEVEPNEITLKTTNEHPSEQVKFSIRNNSGRPVTFGETSSTCGCTVASIEPKMVLQGKTAILTADIVSVTAGMKRIEISVKTNLSTQPELRMHLNVTGSSKVPYVASASEYISFGILHRSGKEVPFFIETRELPASSVWLDTPQCGMPGVSIRGGMASERPLGNNVVLRRYEYVATLDKTPPEGDFRDEVRIVTNDENRQRVRSIRLSGSIVPVVQVSPSSIYGSFSKFEDLPTYTITFRNVSNPEGLEIEPKDHVDKRFSIEKIEVAKNVVTYRVRLIEPFGKELETELSFRTNAAEMPQILMPVRLRVRE